MEDFIKLKRKETTKIGIKDANGNDTGEYLEFDFEDVELPLKYQECLEQHKKNINYLSTQMLLIDKREDKKGKKLLSANTEDKIKVLREYYSKEMSAMDLFLGENGCKKLLNGRKPYFSMFDDINDMIEPILPVLNNGVNSIKDKIANKYKKKEENILE